MKNFLNKDDVIRLLTTIDLFRIDLESKKIEKEYITLSHKLEKMRDSCKGGKK